MNFEQRTLFADAVRDAVDTLARKHGASFVDIVYALGDVVTLRALAESIPNGEARFYDIVRAVVVGTITDIGPERDPTREAIHRFNDEQATLKAAGLVRRPEET